MDALLVAVLNALWQGAALIAIVTLALRAGLRRNATTACVVWSITFAVVALLPAIDLALARPAPVRAAKAAFESAPALAATPVLARAQLPRQRHAPPGAVSRDADLIVRAPGIDSFAALDGIAERFDALALQAGSGATSFVRAWGLVLAGAWALVAGTLLLRLAAAYAAVARIKRGAEPFDDPLIAARLRAAGHRRRAVIARSAQIEIPCAIGFRRPMILIPERLAATLDAEDVARIVLHESAHLQRYDDWVNALEQTVCALQFFQPALYVARRSIDFEREVACDDRVLEDVGEPLRYAECLARIVRSHARGRQAAVVPGFVLRRTQVVARVRRIVDRSRDASPHLRIGAAVLGGVVMVATLGIARLQVPVVAAAAAGPATPVAPAAPAPAPVLVPAAAPPHVPALAHPRVPRAAHRLNAAPAAAPVAALPHAVPPARVAPLPEGVPRWKIGSLPRVVPPQHVLPLPRLAPVTPAAPRPALVAPMPRVRLLRAMSRVAALDVDVAPEARVDIIEDHGAMVERIDARARAVAAAAVAPVATVRVATQFAMVPKLRAAFAATPDAPKAPPATMVRARDGDLLAAIDEAKYPRASVDELIALRSQGVGADYIRRMGALGRGRPALRQLLALATQGVTPEYVEGLDRRLASPPTIDDILALRVQGVSAAWLDGLAAAGYRKLSSSEAIALAVQGVSPGYVRRLAEHGYRNASVDEIVRLKASGFEP